MEQRSLEEALLEQLKYSNVDREKLSDAVLTTINIKMTEGQYFNIFSIGDAHNV